MIGEILFFLIVLFLLFTVYMSLFAHQTKTISYLTKNGNTGKIDLEVSDDALKITYGLMFRFYLPSKNGMIFIFNKSDLYSFWMLNTFIPLEAIYLDEEGIVVDIIKLEPFQNSFLKTYTPKQKSKYVIEVNSGYSHINGIDIGTKFTL